MYFGERMRRLWAWRNSPCEAVPVYNDCSKTIGFLTVISRRAALAGRLSVGSLTWGLLDKIFLSIDNIFAHLAGEWRVECSILMTFSVNNINSRWTLMELIELWGIEMTITESMLVQFIFDPRTYPILSCNWELASYSPRVINEDFTTKMKCLRM